MDNLKLKDTYGKIAEVRRLLEEMQEDIPPYTYAADAVFEALKSMDVAEAFLSKYPFDPLHIGKTGERENENPDVVIDCGQHESVPEEKESSGEDNESVKEADEMLVGGCPKCGNVVCSLNKFCAECGQRLYWGTLDAVQ